MVINIHSTPMWKAVSLIDGENPSTKANYSTMTWNTMQISRINYAGMIRLYKSFLKPWDFYGYSFIKCSRKSDLII